jgi:hypothetical protein
MLHVMAQVKAGNGILNHFIANQLLFQWCNWFVNYGCFVGKNVEVFA